MFEERLGRVEGEALLVDPLEGLRPDLSLGDLPHDLRHGETFPHSVEDVHEGVIEVLDVLHHLPCGRGDLLVLGAVGGRQDVPLEARHRELAGLQDPGEVKVLLLHLLEELRLARHVPLVRLLEDPGEALRGEPLGGVGTVAVPDRLDGDFFEDGLVGTDLPAELVYEHN
jgi:hypothetical protein